MDTEKIKHDIAEYVLKYIKNKMVVGLGSGSTVNYFIKALANKCANGLSIKTIASSESSWSLAEKCGLEVIDINDASRVHLTVDGADEVDHKKRMIKGGGGALLREKILASSSDHVIILIDETKYVPKLGKFPLPVEVALFGAPATKAKIEALGYECRFRIGENELFVTDNNNLILDIFLPSVIDNPEHVEEVLKNVPGVLDTGFFFNLAEKVILGKANGQIQEL